MGFSDDYKAASVADLFAEFGETATLIPSYGSIEERTVIVETHPQRQQQAEGGTGLERAILLKTKQSDGDVRLHDQWDWNGDRWAIRSFDSDQSRHGVIAMRCVRRERREIAHDGYRLERFG